MTRHSRYLCAAASLAAFCLAPSLQAASTTSITLYTDSSPSVIGNSSYPAGFGSSSWQADASSPADGNTKPQVYIPIGELFSGPVTVDDIASITYYTNKPGDAGAPDWSLYIYTDKTGTDDKGSFYHSRLTAEPYFTNTPNANDPANTWHEWSTDGSNPLRFYENRSGSNGTYTDPTLADLQAGSVTWNGSGESGASYDYGADTLSILSFQTGTAWAGGFTGLIDGATITLKNGDSGIVNFEARPTPLPSAATMGLGMMGLLAGAGLLRKKIQTA